MSIKGEYILSSEAAQLAFTLPADDSSRINHFEFSSVNHARSKILRLKNGVTPYELPLFNNHSRLIVTAAKVEIIGAAGLRPYFRRSSNIDVVYPIEIHISRLVENQGTEREDKYFFLHNFGEWEEQGIELLPLPDLGFFYDLKLSELRFEYDSLAMQDIFRSGNASAVVLLKVKCAGIKSEV